MAFQYHSENGKTLTRSQEELLETIENLPVPFDGLSTLSELRRRTGVTVVISDRMSLKRILKDCIHSIKTKIEEYKTSGIIWNGNVEGEINDRLSWAERQLGKAEQPQAGDTPILGLYSRKLLWFDNSAPVVYLFADNIRDYAVQHPEMDEDNVFAFVFVHEMMHALMDINILAPYHNSNINSIPEWFRVLREESLAEAGSLTMMDRVWSKKDINYLKKLMSHPTRPFQYRLGSSYFKAGNDVVWRAIENWVEREYNQQLAEDWFRYIKRTYPRTDSKQLELYEEGFNWPYVFKYQSNLRRPHDMILYSDEDLVIRIIRAYAEKHQTSKSELMAAFPDNLNEDYEVFIDPLIQDHFVSKSCVSDDTPDENFSVDCKDGKLIICSYWHPNSMHPFVEHARKLGFNIVDFWAE